MATFITGLLLIGVTAWIIRGMIKKKKSGKSSCCGDCGHCGGHCSR